ncbi:DUF6973 domain-containing protein [Mycolicibacterium thermoresistibile]|uniref:Uncharacterized protein n=2 Tax=Mycolicibacterium thermoresistibile TaxID=1797 RepID=G7CEY0_MYCT3|nr:EspA/EspE family type VII secretion system effector [Mycolicibacterium thermoresistibile]EHI13059.1 hypothetical protein KEK_07747 [Mycolicibacterium thermoresistibile ATCC 19527]GAT15936.1 putative uncharacterized protein [Mycolicibacterium thermoresistibile]SNW20244.1 Uncharacterised protein [Mycolicibacterium thermoresistibile]
MSALAAFLTTWSAARATFGEGTPRTGERFDHSALFHRLQAEAQTAAPGDVWTGTAADAYGAVNSEMIGVLGGLAALDVRLRAQVDSAAEVVSAGRRDLESIRQAVTTAAAALPTGTVGERMLWPIVAQGLGEITGIVRRSSGDLSQIGAELTRIGEEYRQLSEQKFGGGLPEQPAGEAPGEEPEHEDEDPAEAERDRRLEEIMRDYQVGEDPDGVIEWKSGGLVGMLTGSKEMTATEGRMMDELGLFGQRDMQQIVEQAREEANKRFPPPEGREIDNHNDAFRHAYWNALMTQRFGDEWAEKFATAHEGIPRNYAASEAMDLFNNEVGRNLAVANPDASKDELADLVEQAVRNGDTVVVRPDGQGLEWSDRITPESTGDSSRSAPVDGQIPTPAGQPNPHGGYEIG